MSQSRIISFVVVACIAGCLTSAGHGQGCQDSTRISDRIIVRIAPGSTLQGFITEFTTRNPTIGVQPIDEIPGRPIHLLALQLPPETTAADLDALEVQVETAYPDLVWGEMLYESETPEGSTGSTLVDRPALSAAYQDQYALGKLGFNAFADAKGLSLGSNPVHDRSTGRGVVVAILDTGIDANHPQLASRIVPGGFDFQDGDDDPSDSTNGLDDDLDGQIDEMAGHGSYVAGLVALIAPDAGILPVRVLNSDGRGDLWTLALGLFHAVDRGVEVISVSIGSTYRSSAVEDAVDEAQFWGIPVIAAAGNCNQTKPRTYPGMGSGALAVAALDADDVKASFSNYGDRIFISAPGVSDGITTEPDLLRSLISVRADGDFAIWEGTSMSTPMVAAVFALVRSQHPEFPSIEATADILSFIVANTADPIDGLNPLYVQQLGSGRLNALTAVSAGPIAPRIGDLNGDGRVEIQDFLTVIADWGATHSSADLNADGHVGIEDFLLILAHWG